jgi:hypothetical protein
VNQEVEIAMANARPEILKKTDNELVMRTADGRTVESTKLPDGSFHIKNSNGEEAVFSNEDIRKLVENSIGKEKHAKDMRTKFKKVTQGDRPKLKNELQIIGGDDELVYQSTSIIGTVDLYPTVKEMTQQPKVKEALLNAFRDYVNLIDDGEWTGLKDSPENIKASILEYPKVIVENHYKHDVSYMGKELGYLEELKLPFPKIVVISGAQMQSDDLHVGFTDTTDQTEVNMIFAFYMSQVEDGVVIDCILADRKTLKDHIYLTQIHMSVKHGDIQFMYDTEQPIAPPLDHLSDFMRSAVVALYMMTLNGGDFYMSVPTPEDAKINAKRIRKGKKPLVEFRLITVTGKKNEIASLPHGSHASPRQHWRRGHWRFMKKSGKKVWVDPMLVGDEKNGKIIKDYAIGKYEEERKH